MFKTKTAYKNLRFKDRANLPPDNSPNDFSYDNGKSKTLHRELEWKRKRFATSAIRKSD